MRSKDVSLTVLSKVQLVWGKEDKPENYNTVLYVLEPVGEQTTLTITQDTIATEKEKEHSAKNWDMVLDGMKELLEA